jgi:acyl transferase domain-containing protein/acetylornithine/succinyldiaminopimelate/putrescine aminotransferase
MSDIQSVENQDPLDGIAIVGMVGRFPGANNVDELWQNLRAGVESIEFFADEDLDPSVDPELLQDPSYVKARGMISDGELFDAAFFGINPREAESIDPQARIFLELVAAALENAGYNPDTYDGLIGLYASCAQNTYFIKHICGRQDIIDRIGEVQMMIASENDYLTTRASYKLNLKGPSISINTSCSSSLVAVSQAVQALTSYQCDLAISGAVSMATPQNVGHLHQEGGIYSPDGHCRPFDVRAQGTVFSNGGGLVVLKRLEDAMQDGDRIYAVIRGVGVNNDGADKVSFSAPSVDGQAQAIAMAQAYADFPPESITYIETHGTATPLGDPIEVAALTQAFRLQTQAKQFCAIGSIKSNIGHLADAAGVVGLIKTALALHHKQIPPTLHFQAPNPRLDLEHSPFFVNTQLMEWVAGATPRRAGVSSFGVGGTNAHLVLEEAPVLPASGESRPQQLLLLSAKTSTALETATDQLQTYLAAHPNVNLADVAYTLNQGRKGFQHRRYLVCQDPADGVKVLATQDVLRMNARPGTMAQPGVVFMFPGQGSQYVNMGVTLYQDEAVFRETVDRCIEILQPLMGMDLRSMMYPQPDDVETAAISLKETRFTQPALFVTEYALAQLWQSWGIQPQAAIGHSIGEFVAACLAGVFSLPDALKLVAARGRLMWDLPRGSMLSVRLAAAELEPRLSPDLAIAAINSPFLCVVAGPTESIDRLKTELVAAEIVCRDLHTSHAFHSPMMEPILAPLLEIVLQVKLAPPQIPLVSTVTGDWLTDQQATDPQYWATHLRQTVRFADGIRTLWQQPERVLLELGPRTTTATLARQQAQDLQHQIAISTLSDRPDRAIEWTAILQALGQLWLAGVTIDWQAFYQRETRSRLPLPTYPFERQRFWIDPPPHPHRQVNPATIEPSALPQLVTTIPTVQIMSASDKLAASHQSTIALIKAVIESASGLEMSGVDESTTFLAMGLDSLSLTQVGLALKKKFQVPVSLRQLLETSPNLGTLAEFITPQLPAAEIALPILPIAPEVQLPIPVLNDRVAPIAATVKPADSNISSSYLEATIAQQLQIMAQQLALLGGQNSITALPNPLTVPANHNGNSPKSTILTPPIAAESNGVAKPFGAVARIEKTPTSNLTAQQQTQLDRIIQRYNHKTRKSKEFTQTHRAYLADPRTVSGFNPLLKEMVYQIVVERSSGSKLWDLDGNEYIDLCNGFGSNLFGWSPPFITAAITQQLQLGMEIGPQSPLIGEVAKLVCELTNTDRVAFCNTGSEAVLAAMRMARTITGRNLIAIFSGSYHGMFDEVVVRGTKQLRSLPAAPGIPPEMVANILVLDYDSEALAILNSRADELAAVMVEPVQSRRPDYQPQALLQQLRDFTSRVEIPLIFDEVVTGFRIHPGGAQAHFGVKADIATYGKIVGGGLPIGVVAGKSKYLDALDGGWWQFGDDSIPEVGVTYFAGTFVRHPLALAAAKAVLEHLNQNGPSLQQQLNATTERFVSRLTDYFDRVIAPFTIERFGSLFLFKSAPDFPYSDLFFYLLREKGIHIWNYRPCFLTTAHTAADLELVFIAIQASLAELQAAGFVELKSIAQATNSRLEPIAAKIEQNLPNHPPVTNAKLGRNPQGDPAWYIPDPDRVGKYLQITDTRIITN